MKPQAIAQLILKNRQSHSHHEMGMGYAPTNIALAKYWGKRDAELNLPQTSSLSIALPEKGAFTTIRRTELTSDQIFLNGAIINPTDPFAKRLIHFLNLVRPQPDLYFHIETQMNIPVSAGLASSACGFAALTLALNDFFAWQLDNQSLSILARLGSGSACRSFWPGFVKWQAGQQPDGMDSYAEPLQAQWPSLRIGLLTLSRAMKSLSSRQAMQQAVDTSRYYPRWPELVAEYIAALEAAIAEKNFDLFGKTAEANALAMHATSFTAWPPFSYWTPETMAVLQKIWLLRAQGLKLFFTEDAGPNIKLLFLESDTQQVQAEFPMLDLLTPFVTDRPDTQVILVDQQDRALGQVEKIAAHQQGLCHRAFSVFIFRQKNGQRELLLQRRHPDKYHCGNLWTNTCCSHPQPGESLIAAAQQRLKEEMGIEVPLIPFNKFHYTAHFNNGLTENEVDHVLVGFADPQNIQPDPQEVIEHRWLPIAALNQELKENPQNFTPWFAEALNIALIIPSPFQERVRMADKHQ